MAAWVHVEARVVLKENSVRRFMLKGETACLRLEQRSLHRVVFNIFVELGTARAVLVNKSGLTDVVSKALHAPTSFGVDAYAHRFRRMLACSLLLQRMAHNGGRATHAY